MIHPDRFWSTDASKHSSGVSREQVRAWERLHGVTLPKVLNEVFARQNGGLVRNSNVELLPLDEVQPVRNEVWDDIGFDEADATDRRLIFHLGQQRDAAGVFLMNFNTRGPKRKPSVYVYHGDGTGVERSHGTIDDFLDDLMAFSSDPLVNWSEVERCIAIVAREEVDLTAFHNGVAHLEQVLAREGQTLMLYTREVNPDAVILSKTTLPEPLVAFRAGIQPRRPAPSPTLGLHLQPEDRSGVVREEATRTEDGRWTNTTSEGVPAYVTFESTERGRLEALRVLLLGEAGAESARPMDAVWAGIHAMPVSSRPDDPQSTLLK